MGEALNIRLQLEEKQALAALTKLEAESKNFTESFVDGIKLSDQAFNIFKGSVAASALLTAFGKIKEVISETAEEAVDFRRALLEIETILPQGTSLTAELVNQLKLLSQQYGTTPSSQAKAYYQIISAGVSDAAAGAKLLQRANELAAGGVTDTASTIDLLTTIYNVYGKEVATASEASDSLFKTVQLGKTTISELSADLGQALPIAKSFGIGLDEVGAILAQLTNSGISTAESVTLLNAILTAIARNGAELGQGFNSTAVQTEGLGVVLERLRARTKGSNDALFELLGRQEAVRAVQALTSKGLENYNATLAEYSNKSGVAAEAAKKIVDNDVGKQFDILGEKIKGSARNFVDIFIPATLAATKALNDFFTPGELDSAQVTRGLDETRKRIADLEEAHNRGRISTDAYKRSMKQLNDELAHVSMAAETATAPLVLLSTGLEKEAANIKAQIGALKNGFDNLQLGPIERDLKIEELNQKLLTTQSRIKELNKSASETVPVAPTMRSEQAIQEELKLQADLKAIKDQAYAEEISFQAQRDALDTENEFVRRQQEIDAVYQLELAKIEAMTEAEIAKTKFIKDSAQKKAAQDKINADAELKTIKAQNTKLLAEQQNFNRQDLANQDAFLTAASSLSSAKNKELAAIGKAAAITQIAIKTPPAIASSYEFGTKLGGPVLGAALGAIAATAMAAQAANIAGVKFEQGGFVPGLPGYGDQVQVRANPGEAYLNTAQQKEFMDIANGRSGNSNISEKIDKLIDAILRQPVVLQINNRELGSALRDLKAGGFQF